MSHQRKQILEMLSSGKINTDEAEKLLEAIKTNSFTTNDAEKETKSTDKPKFLCVKVEGGSYSKCKNVDVKIPIVLLKAGMKFGSIMPDGVKGKFSSCMNEHGVKFDLNNLNSENIDSFIVALKDNSIDIDSDDGKVRVFCI